MEEFFETIPGQPHTTVHSRVWQHLGAIVDVGCAGYDWCGVFVGKKRVIGLDPDLRVTPIPGVELMQTQLGPYSGVVAFRGSTSVDAPADGPQAPIWDFKRFCRAAIDARGIAVLKLNIEGGEWPLLASMDESDFAQIDQLAVSFHDFVWPEMRNNTLALTALIESRGFVSKEIYKPLGWYLFH